MDIIKFSGTTNPELNSPGNPGFEREILSCIDGNKNPTCWEKGFLLMALQEFGGWLSELAYRQPKGCMLPGLLDSHDKMPCIDGTRMLHWRQRFCQTLLILTISSPLSTRFVTNLGAIPSRLSDSGLRSRDEAIYALTLQIHGKMKLAETLEAEARPASGCAGRCQTVCTGMYVCTSSQNSENSHLSQTQVLPVLPAASKQPQDTAKPFGETSCSSRTHCTDHHNSLQRSQQTL